MLISGYRTTDLRLYFHLCKNPVFSRHGSYFLMDIILLLMSDFILKKLNLIKNNVHHEFIFSLGIKCNTQFKRIDVLKWLEILYDYECCLKLFLLFDLCHEKYVNNKSED